MTELDAVRGDITTQRVDAIVNAANTSLSAAEVDGAIHRAGGPALLEACRSSRHHAAGRTADRFRRRDHGGAAAGAARDPHGRAGVDCGRRPQRALRSAYWESLRVAQELGALSVAFPAISAGVYGWPMPDAASIGVAAVRDYVSAGAGALELVRFVLFSDTALSAFAGALGR